MVRQLQSKQQELWRWSSLSGNYWFITSDTQSPLESTPSLGEWWRLYMGPLILQGLMWPEMWCSRPRWDVITPHIFPDVLREWKPITRVRNPGLSLDFSQWEEPWVIGWGAHAFACSAVSNGPWSRQQGVFHLRTCLFNLFSQGKNSHLLLWTMPSGVGLA